MKKITVGIFSALVSLLLFSCSNNFEEISQTQFVDTILPEVEIIDVEIRNDETALISTSNDGDYRIEMDSPNSTEFFLNKVRSRDPNIPVSYITAEPDGFSFLHIFHFIINLAFPLLILSHIILLWIALKKIIKSDIENTEKLVYTIISIFFPFFGPIIYLTTRKSQ